LEEGNDNPLGQVYAFEIKSSFPPYALRLSGKQRNPIQKFDRGRILFQRVIPRMPKKRNI